MGARAWGPWALVAAGVLVPIGLAAQSPLLQWREPVYIAAGFAGIAALALMLVQPLLALGVLPGLAARRGRRAHHLVGAALVALVIVHVAALWLTSPPDVVDVLLLRSPTPFSLWGVLAMWAVFVTAGLAVARRALGARLWRKAHFVLILLIVPGSVVHALLIEGTMEPVSKAVLSLAVALGAAWAVRRRRLAGVFLRGKHL